MNNYIDKSSQDNEVYRFHRILGMYNREKTVQFLTIIKKSEREERKKRETVRVLFKLIALKYS